LMAWRRLAEDGPLPAEDGGGPFRPVMGWPEERRWAYWRQLLQVTNEAEGMDGRQRLAVEG